MADGGWRMAESCNESRSTTAIRAAAPRVAAPRVAAPRVAANGVAAISAAANGAAAYRLPRNSFTPALSLRRSRVRRVAPSA
jgi:hypothetical protein